MLCSDKSQATGFTSPRRHAGANPEYLSQAVILLWELGAISRQTFQRILPGAPPQYSINSHKAMATLSSCLPSRVNGRFRDDMFEVVSCSGLSSGLVVSRELTDYIPYIIPLYNIFPYSLLTTSKASGLCRNPEPRWYSIGSHQIYAGGMPGPPGTIVDLVELWVSTIEVTATTTTTTTFLAWLLERFALYTFPLLTSYSCRHLERVSSRSAKVYCGPTATVTRGWYLAAGVPPDSATVLRAR